MTKKYTVPEIKDYIKNSGNPNVSRAFAEITEKQKSELNRELYEYLRNIAERNPADAVLLRERVLKMQEHNALSYFERLLNDSEQSDTRLLFASETFGKEILTYLRVLVESYKDRQAEIIELRKFKDERLSKIKNTNEKASIGRIRKADDYAVNLQNEFTRIKNELKEEGAKYTFVEMAKRLTEANIPAPRGDKWNHNTVHRYEDRINKLERNP